MYRKYICLILFWCFGILWYLGSSCFLHFSNILDFSNFSQFSGAWNVSNPRVGGLFQGAWGPGPWGGGGQARWIFTSPSCWSPRGLRHRRPAASRKNRGKSWKYQHFAKTQLPNIKILKKRITKNMKILEKYKKHDEPKYPKSTKRMKHVSKIYIFDTFLMFLVFFDIWVHPVFCIFLIFWIFPYFSQFSEAWNVSNPRVGDLFQGAWGPGPWGGRGQARWIFTSPSCWSPRGW